MKSEAKPHIILDTNTFVSGIIFKGDLLRRLVNLAVDEYRLVFSNETWDELSKVFQREKFEENLPLGTRLSVLAFLASTVTVIHPTSIVSDCRDPKDNKFLALALDANVETIISGDGDLKALDPWRGIRIVSPEEFARSVGLK
jgi:uncharacterized protein